MSIFIEGPPGLSWEEARQKVRGDLWRPGNSLPDDVVDRALHASVLELEGECAWLWLENLTTLFTLDDASFVDLPATIGTVTAVSVRRTEWLEPLDQRPLAVVRQDANTVLGFPSAWALGDARIWFDRRITPAAEFEVVFTASTPEVLEEAIEAPSFTLHRQQQAVIANACHFVALDFMKNEAEAGRQRAAYDRILQRLFNVEAQRRGSSIQPDTWGQGCG